MVGLAGSSDKCSYLVNTLKFDAVLNYKTELSSGTLRQSLQQACPQGVDVYFDNTGGEISDTVIPLINQFARIVICGQISTYNNTDSGASTSTGGAAAVSDSKDNKSPQTSGGSGSGSGSGSSNFGPRLLHHLLWNSASMTGFLVQDFTEHDSMVYHKLGEWIRDSRIISEEDILPIDEKEADLGVAPQAFCKLFTGANKGKQCVRVSKATGSIEQQIRVQNETAAKEAKAAKDAAAAAKK